MPRLFLPALLACFLVSSAAPAAIPAGTFVDIDAANTRAVGGTPAPFFTDHVANPGFTSGNLWRRRIGFGFTAYVAAPGLEIFEKDANGGVGDATLLETTVTGLVPGQSYGVHVAFLSVPSESWQVRGGLSPTTLEIFSPSSPPGRITDVGPSTESGSNRNQYLGFIGNAVAKENGTLTVYSDDGDGTAANFSTRSWLEGFLIGEPVTPPPLPAGAVEIAPDGAWTWFNDERSIFHQGSLFSGYVKGNGEYGITRRDLATGLNHHMIISTAASQQQDDHNNPSITALPDGRLLALYSKHIAGSQFYQRTSLVPLPTTSADWGPEIVRPTPAANTYANTYLLSGEGNAIYNFTRAVNFNPSITISTDNGASWGPMRQLVGTGSGSTRPYPRYASNGVNRIDMLYTDGHPRDVNNSVYHLYYQGGAFHKTDGTLIDSFANIPLDHDAGERGSVIYQYSDAPWGAGDGPDDWIPTGCGWTWDIHYARDGQPVCVFQVQRDNVTGSGWNHDRIYYYYARWTGTSWQRRFIAHAGRPLYSAEDDYGGGMCLDPEDPRVVYISTNAAHPFNLGDVQNVPLRANDRYEIYRGFTADGGLTFTWTPVTENSAADNLRPIVPPKHPHTRDLIWFYGTYRSYTSYSTQVLASFGEKRETLASWAEQSGLLDADPADDDDIDGRTNLLEYGIGGNPTVADVLALPAFEESGFSLRIFPARTDIEWIVEESADLATWRIAATIRPAGLPWEVAEGYSASFSADPHPLVTISAAEGIALEQLFMRVRVQHRP
ncbi:MAG: BNR-4 repeat-containing protein [Chthoniobacteraceae bacterium]